MKTVIVGTGRMGQSHIQASKELDLDIVGVCDKREEVLSEAKNKFGLEGDKCFSDFNSMIEATNPEVVIVATTTPSHADLVCQAAERGVKYVLCEKPMASSVADCDRMIKICKKYDTFLSVNHQMRFMDQYKKVKELIDAPEFGGLSSMSVVAGCFGLAMNGTHYFEAFRYLTNEGPKEINAWFADEEISNPRGANFKDKAGSVRFITESGKRFYMEVGADQGHGMTVMYSAPYGHIFVDELAGEITATYRQKEYRDYPMTRYGMPFNKERYNFPVADNIKPTKAVLEALVQEKNFPTGEEGRQAVAILASAYKSAENDHKTVQFNNNEFPSKKKFPWA